MANAPMLDHVGLRVLNTAECLRHLANTLVGRLAFVDAGSPVILPVNYAMDGSSIVFRTGEGSKAFMAARAQAVAFEVDGVDTRHRIGWSVVVSGMAQSVEDPDEVDALERLGVTPWVRDGRPYWVRIRAEEITGREIVGDAVPAQRPPLASVLPGID